MATRTELLEIVRNGENSGVEFKRDVVANYDLAKELVAFSNLNGGMVLLGVKMRARSQASHAKIWRSGS
jgi:ATP-dependent DNA helicase RecG